MERNNEALYKTTIVLDVQLLNKQAPSKDVLLNAIGQEILEAGILPLKESDDVRVSWERK